LLRGEYDKFTVSLDTSGDLLHRRGWRSEGGEAPLRETLAAGLCQLAGWTGEALRPLRDPTCGSGTLVIEAALLLRRRAPGLHRAFAFQSFSGYKEELFRALCREAVAAERPCPPGLVAGSDLSPDALLLARRNAERAGVGDIVAFECQDVARARLPAGAPGLVLCNPPYGKRLAVKELRSLYRAIGQYARSAPGWRLGLLSPHAMLARAAARSAIAHPVDNGGLRIGFYVSGGLAEPTRGYYAEECNKGECP
jgi:putative N6-adenine-specific DNA methylase